MPGLSLRGVNGNSTRDLEIAGRSNSLGEQVPNLRGGCTQRKSLDEGLSVG